MCGIAGVYIKDPSVVKSHAGLERFVNSLLLGIESRGKHATGFVAVDRNGRVVIDKAAEEASKFIFSRERLPNDLWYVLLHTRYATKGKPDNHLNNHPVIWGDCFTVHNGAVRNDDELFKEFGFRRRGEVDTEIIPALMSMTDFQPNAIAPMLNETRGPIAMATIDPKNHPGKVILARTESSPMMIIDTPKFLVWASESKAIRDAWARVLGTPPEYKRIKYMPEYTFSIVDENGLGQGWKLTRPIHNKRFGFESSNEDPTKGTTSTTSGESCPIPTVANGSIIISPGLVRERVLALRKDGMGKVTTWEMRESGKRNGVKWVTCHTCKELLPDEEMVQTLARGRMCFDCADMYNKVYAEMAASVEDSEDDGEVQNEDDYCDPQEFFSADKLHQMNLWSEDEDLVHKTVMSSIVEETGLQEELLEFLMFRLDVTGEHKNNTNLCGLVTALWDMYDSRYSAEWESHPTSLVTDFDDIVKVGKVVNIVRRTKAVLINGNAHKRPKKCLFCNRKPKLAIVQPKETHGFQFNYCNRHWLKCGVQSCNSKAVHVRQDGIRVCHQHARGTTVYTEEQLTEKGCTLVEVEK